MRNTTILKILEKTMQTTVFGLIALIRLTGISNAQNNRQDQRQRQKVEKQERKDQERQIKREDQQIRTDQRQEQNRIRNMPNQSVNPGNDRYRVDRNGSYYETNNRGAELLRQAVNADYQEGYRAGRDDRNRRRSSDYNGSSVYRKGNYGYQNYVNLGQYQYYFQQGFQRGYEDGFNSRYQYGTNNNGSLNILGAILQGILNFEQF